MSIHQTPDGRWYVKFRDEYARQRKIYTGRGPQAKAEAKAIDAEIKAAKARGQRLHRPGSVFLDELAQAYVADREPVCSESYISEIRNLLNKYFLPKLCHRPVDKLTYEDVLKAMEPFRDRSVATRNRYMGYLRAIFRWGIRHGLTEHNPLRGWQAAKEHRRRANLTVEDLRRIMDHAAPHLRWALEVEWNLGTRPGPSELFSLKWKDVDWEKGQVWIYGRKTKQWRAVPIGDHFLVRLREMKDKAKTEFIIEYQGKPIKKLRRSLESACRRAGIPYRVRMYDVRHLFASVMLAGGADLAAVAAIMGHSIDTLQRNYYELLKGEKKRAIQLLPPLSGPQKGPQNHKRSQAI